MGKIFISCEDANILSTRNQYNDLNAKERFRYKLHHKHCPQCNKIDKKNARFTSKLNHLGWKRLSHLQKQAIKERLLAALSK